MWIKGSEISNYNVFISFQEKVYTLILNGNLKLVVHKCKLMSKVTKGHFLQEHWFCFSSGLLPQMISPKQSLTFSDGQEEQTQADHPFCVVLILLPLSVLEKFSPTHPLNFHVLFCSCSHKCPAFSLWAPLAEQMGAIMLLLERQIFSLSALSFL